MGVKWSEENDEIYFEDVELESNESIVDNDSSLISKEKIIENKNKNTIDTNPSLKEFIKKDKLINFVIKNGVD